MVISPRRPGRPDILGTPPRVQIPRAGGVLSYFRPTGGRGWLLLPDTVGSRIAAGIRVAGVFVLLGVLIASALAYDEYDRATRRLALPFKEQNADYNWSTPGYVKYRQDAARHRLRQCAVIGSVAACGVAGAALYTWRRRRRARWIG